MGRRHLRTLVSSLALAVALLLAVVAPARVAAEDAATLLKAREAGAALARGNHDQAVALFTEALQDKTLPNERRATMLTDRGVAHARRQSPREAIEDFNRAVVLFPEHAAIYNNRGTVLLGIGAVREAMKDFDRALLLAPGYAAAYSNRAGAHLKLGHLEAAIADYTKAIALAPASPAAFTGRGRAHLAAQRPLAASRDFTRAVGLDARFSAAYRSRAEAKLAVERWDEAIEDFSRAIAFDPRNADLHVARGGAYLEAGNAASAIKDFTTAIEIAPRNVAAYVARGLAYARSELSDEALNDFARAIEFEPRSAKAFAYRAWTYRQQRPELALKDVERALRLDAASAEAHWARGAIHEAQGRGTQAVADLEKALSLDPQLKPARLALQKLGVLRPDTGEEVADAGVEGWRVFTRGSQYVATSDKYPRLKIDIEMLGKGRPRLLEWEVKAAPFAGIGVMRFFAGEVDSPKGPEEVDQVAIVDLQASTVVAVEVHRRGTRVAKMTWEGGKLIMASADGTVEELALRTDTAKKVAEKQKEPCFSPWGGPCESRRGRPKTLFELLFGN
jgi:tetratricopeptide (TPR) repeat protein